VIAILIPLFNEEENVKIYPERLFPVIDRIAEKYGDSFQYIMVDDGSRDSTLQQLHELERKYPNVVVFAHEKNQGLGAALRTGFAHCTADLVITLDSDLTYRPQDIELLLEAYRNTQADCISASPYREKHHSNAVDSPFRLFISKSVNLLYRTLLWRDITCVSAIFRLYTLEAIDELSLESTNFDINAEILSKLILNGKFIVEVGVPLHEREYGESKLNVKKEIGNNTRILLKILKSRFFGLSW